MRPEKHKVDGQVGSYLVAVKTGVQSIRSLREALIQLAYRLVDCPSKKALLVLPNSKVTQRRLTGEQEKALKAFRPEITKRLNLVFVEGEDFLNLPAGFSKSQEKRLKQLVRGETTTRAERLPRVDGYFEILKLIILQWSKSEPPMTAKWLMETTGYSYPTVAKALARLGSNIKRHSDRRVELHSFPRDEWARLVAVSDKVRSAVYFVDTSGQPRPLESLMSRLRKLHRADIAVGGVYGAKHYYPNLDLVGSPRLDVTMHCPDETWDLDFVKRLDPGLEKVENLSQPIRFVVHALRRKEPFFESGSDELPWSDPVECLLDLHEAHLEAQALDFLNFLIAGRNKAR